MVSRIPAIFSLLANHEAGYTLWHHSRNKVNFIQWKCSLYRRLGQFILISVDRGSSAGHVDIKYHEETLLGEGLISVYV